MTINIVFAYIKLMEIDTLIDIGLSREEAKIYLTLLENGQATASTLATKSQIKRTYIYALCQNMVKKGLITLSKKGKKTTFVPQSPQNLLSISEEKRARTAKAHAQLEQSLPSLSVRYKAIEAKPIVQIFEGVEGLKKIYNDTLKVGKEISAVVETSEMDPALRSWLKEHYIHERAKAKIHAKVILASGKLSSEYQSRNQKAYRTVIEVPSSKYPIKHEVDVYGDKVAFIKYHKDEPLVGLVIDNALVAHTMRAWFNLSWKGALSEIKNSDGKKF